MISSIHHKQRHSNFTILHAVVSPTHTLHALLAVFVSYTSLITSIGTHKFLFSARYIHIDKQQEKKRKGT